MDSLGDGQTATMTDADVLDWTDSTIRRLSLNLGEPKALLERRLEAFKRLQRTPWPTPLDEAWRKTDPQRIGRKKFKLWASNARTDCGDKHAPDGWRKLIMSNCEAVEEDAIRNWHDPKIGVGSIRGGFDSDFGDALADDILAVPDDSESPAISLLHLAFYQGGAWVSLSENTPCEQPIYLHHRLSAPGSALFPLNIISVAPGSQAVVVLEQEALADRAQWICAMTRVKLGARSNLQMVVVNRSDASTNLYSHTLVRLGRNARFQMTWADLTLGWTVARCEAYLEGVGAEAGFRGAHIGAGNSRIDVRSLQDHTAAQTTSNLLYKAALFGSSKSVYQGLIHVHPEARAANAYQLNRNLLMNPGARADSIPKLEIKVDEVRCTHGASTGKVDPDALFYMMTRGLTKSQATRLLIEGFLLEAGDDLPEGDLKAYWQNHVTRATERVLRGE